MHDSRPLLATLLLVLAVLPILTPLSYGQIIELPRPYVTSGDFFGTAVAIDGNHVIVGATAVNSCGVNSGAAYLYERSSGTDHWEAVAELVPSDCSEGTYFGRSVSISGDVAVVAASQEFFSLEASNSAYVFVRDSTGTWRETSKLTGGSLEEEGAFATSVSIDGSRILVTTAGDPVHGRIGGAAYVFERDQETESWAQTARLTASDGVRHGILGTTGALDGDVIAVAASTYFRNRPGSVYFFEKSGEDNWREAGRLGGIDDFFISLDVDSNRVFAGESKEGRHGVATVMERNGAWRAAHTLRPTTPYDAGAFGSLVALDGDYAVVVGYDEQLGLDFNIDRVVFVFKFDSSGWRQHHVIDVGELAFGASLDIDGQYAVIGSASDSAPGTAFVVHIPE